MRQYYTDSLIEHVDSELDYINLRTAIYPLSLLQNHIGQQSLLFDYTVVNEAEIYKSNLVFNTNPDQPDTAISTGVLSINGGLYAEEISSSTDVDFYDLKLGAGESIQILFRHDFIQNLTHNIYDSSGNALVTESFNRSSFNYSVLDFTATTAGTYYVSTQGVNSSDTGGYQIAILQDQYADNDTTQGVINFDGDTISGFYNSENDEDWLSFTLGADETAYFRRVDELGNPNVFFRVVDSNGNEIDAIGHSEGRDSYTISPGEAGTYFLIITGTSLYSEYSFTAERSAGDVAGDTTTQGELIINGPAVNSAISYLGDDDWFRFEAVAGVEYEFEISGIERANVTVYNEIGDGEASHISPGYLTFIPELSGIYYLSVSTSSFSGDLSPYQITSRTITDDFGQTLEDSGTIIINGPTINGAINFRQDVDWLTFEATAGEIIRFDSSVIDPDFLHYLYIYMTWMKTRF